MVEAESEDKMKTLTNHIADAIRAALGTPQAG
jgi:hypothetical protein